MKKKRHAPDAKNTQPAYPRIISQAPKPISTVRGNGSSIYSKPSLNSTQEMNRVETEEGNFFRKEGDAWKVSFDGITVPNIRHLKGMDYIKYLLEHLGRYVPVSEFIQTLPTSEEATRLGKMREDQLEELSLSKSKSLKEGHKVRLSREISERDRQTKEKFRKEIRELEEIIVDPQSPKEEVSEAQTKRKLLINELRAFHDRSTDRPRTAVSMAISRAITHIGKHHRSLAEHLRNHIHLGNECIYSPPNNPDWNR